MYKIYDNQNHSYKSGECKTLDECREVLVDYHSQDWEGQGDINEMSLSELLDYGDWSIHDLEGNYIEVN